MVKLGSAFSDNLVSSGRSQARRRGDDAPWWAGAGRALVFATSLCIGFFVLAFRLFDLTVVKGNELRIRSDTNRTRVLTRHAPRGIFLDRTGRPLVSNIPRYRLLRPCDAASSGECVEFLTKEEGDRLSQDGLPAGEFLEVDYMRQYLYPAALAHVIGYTGELSQEELESEFYRSRNYVAGDRVGRMGTEEVYNERLRGRDGQEYVEVDAAGMLLRSLGRQEELSGEDITLSLDIVVSRAAADAFPPGEKGAVIVSKPDTGEILAMYSSPGFSPNAYARGLSLEDYDALINNPDLPMFNRAIGGAYPPGSTFKIVTALAALEEGAITPDTIVEDTGIIRIGPFTFPNWYYNKYGKTDGNVDVVKALQRSNDIYFYKTGEWLGISKLAAWARKFGIGTPLGIELSGEAGGLMPDPAWKNNHFSTPADREARNNEWYLGDTYHVSIGQGYLLTTPLSVLVWTNSIANDGTICTPTIEKVTAGGLGGNAASCRPLGVRPEHLDVVTEGMVAACASGGTGWPLFGFSVREASDSAAIQVPIACKTGTAEFGDPKDHTHAWFAAYAPIPDRFVPGEIRQTESYISGKPEISVTVLVEGAGEGSDIAAPVAKKIFEAWFTR